MANRWHNTLTSDDVTPEAMFVNRRQMMAGAAALGLGLTASPLRAAGLEPNSFEDITNYNNYYDHKYNNNYHYATSSNNSTSVRL